MNSLVGLNINVGDLNVMKDINTDISCSTDTVLRDVTKQNSVTVQVEHCGWDRLTSGLRPDVGDANYVDEASCEYYWKFLNREITEYVAYSGRFAGTCTIGGSVDTAYTNDRGACNEAGGTFSPNTGHSTYWGGFSGSPRGCYGVIDQHAFKVNWNAEAGTAVNCSTTYPCIVKRIGSIEDYSIKMALNKLPGLNVDSSILKVLNNVNTALDSTQLNHLKGLDITVDELNILKDVSTDLSGTELDMLVGLTTDNYIGTCSNPTITTEAACVAVAGNTWFPVVHGNDLNVMKGVNQTPLSIPPATIETVADIQLVGGHVDTLQSTDPLFLTWQECKSIVDNDLLPDLLVL